MTDVKTITVDGTVYEIKDAVARQDIISINDFFTTTIASTDWTANTDTATKDLYPYICNITSNKYNANSRPIWDCCGASTTGIPTEEEQADIVLVAQAYFDASGITLYATDRLTNSVVFRAKGV